MMWVGLGVCDPQWIRIPSWVKLICVHKEWAFDEYYRKMTLDWRGSFDGYHFVASEQWQRSNAGDDSLGNGDEADGR